MPRKNIILCGFMGCGKTTVGKELAWRIFSDFIDTDARVEQIAGMSIPDIFLNNGEGAFRALETEVIKQVVQDSGQVISIGGGAFLRPENVELAKNNSKIIFLDTSFDLCYNRIVESDRPLIKKHSREEIEQIYNERLPIYRAAADFEVFNQHTPKDAAKAILTSLFSFL